MNGRQIRVLVVDDEPLARRGIVARMARHKDVEVVAESSNGREAAAAIRALKPDVVFLDVQMPGLDGFDLVSCIGAAEMPLVVLVTAHSAHALRAFDIAATDYLLKPLDDARFDQAVDRVRQRMAERERTVVSTSANLSSTEVHASQRLIVRDRGTVVLLDYAEVFWIEAEGDYVRIHAKNRNYLMRSTLAKVAEQLPPTRFVRIHRSTLVNRLRVRQLIPLPNREFTVVLMNGAKLRLSRTYQAHVAALTNEL